MQYLKLIIGSPLLLLLFGIAPTSLAQETQSDSVYLPEPSKEPPAAVVRHQKLQGKYESGELRMEREVALLSDDTIVSDGKYIEYYPDKQKFCEGNYENGVLTGKWSYWHPNGQLCKAIDFEGGRPNGEVKIFREDGTLEAVQNFKKGVRDGIWNTYFEDGKTLKVEANIVNGKIEGKRKTFYPDGKLRQEAVFSGGVLNGLVVEYDETGKKVAEATFENGKRGSIEKFE